MYTIITVTNLYYSKYVSNFLPLNAIGNVQLHWKRFDDRLFKSFISACCNNVLIHKCWSQKSFYLDARFIIIRHNILQSKINTDLINEGVLMDISSNIDWASLLYKKQNAITCIHDKKSAWDYESCTEKVMILKGGSWIHNIIASDVDLQHYEKEVKN